MKSHRRSPLGDQVLAAYLDGEVTSSESSRIESELAESGKARERLDQLQSIRRALAMPVPGLPETDLVADVRAAIAAGAVREQPRSRARRACSALAVAACVGLAALSANKNAPWEDEFQTKGAESIEAGARWSSIQVYRMATYGARPLTEEQLHANDGLMFSYTNLGPRPYRYLMIFAVDAAQSVHWYHPAYDREGTNPSALAIAGGAAQTLLADVVTHDLAPGNLTLYALFARQPIRVAEVERWLRKRSERARLPPRDDVRVTALPLRVTRP